MAKTPTLEEIAERINAHLQRFNRDQIINALTQWDTRPYYYPSAVRSGRFVAVRYVSYQGLSHLKKEEAIRYLAWLDAGHVGKHFQMDRLPVEESEADRLDHKATVEKRDYFSDHPSEEDE